MEKSNTELEKSEGIAIYQDKVRNRAIYHLGFKEKRHFGVSMQYLFATPYPKCIFSCHCAGRQVHNLKKIQLIFRVADLC